MTIYTAFIAAAPLILTAFLIFKYGRRVKNKKLVGNHIGGWAARSSRVLTVPPEGRWYARVFNRGGVGPEWNYEEGMFLVEGGLLYFLKEGDKEPQWSVPCNELRTSPQALLNINRGNALLAGPTFSANVTVSKEHINRIMKNDLKRLREVSYGNEFCTLLYSLGARSL